jgi:hypothetical protein
MLMNWSISVFKNSLPLPLLMFAMKVSIIPSYRQGNLATVEAMIKDFF